MYQYYNPNECGNHVGDCVIRAICKATEKGWHTVYTELCIFGYMMCDWGDSNAVWGAYLRSIGYRQDIIPDAFDRRYTIADFARDHTSGTFLVATGSHLVCIQDGVINDSWDSSDEFVTYYFHK